MEQKQLLLMRGVLREEVAVKIAIVYIFSVRESHLNVLSRISCWSVLLIVQEKSVRRYTCRLSRIRFVPFRVPNAGNSFHSRRRCPRI